MKYSKKYIRYRFFSSTCFDVAKTWNFTSSGVQNRETKNRRRGMIVTSFQDFKLHGKQLSQSFCYCELIKSPKTGTKVRCLQENKKMSEKSVFREAWSAEMTSQSYPVSCFWSRGFVPHWKWNFTFLVHQDTSKKNRYRIYFLLYFISTLWRFYLANKKKSVIYTIKAIPAVGASWH